MSLSIIQPVGGIGKLLRGPLRVASRRVQILVAQDLRQRVYEVLAWSARAGQSWESFLFELEWQLTPDNAQRYDRMAARFQSEGEQAQLLL